MADSVYATLIGDLVGSREAGSRGELQRSLRSALDRVNETFQPWQPLEPTIGDEFQGAFTTPIAAIRASLHLRLFILREQEVDSRFGLGFGEVTVFEEGPPRSQDGPGWWSARTAIERAEKLSRARRTDFVRTCFESEELPQGFSWGEIASINAFLYCRDALVAQMKSRSRRLLLGLILDVPQADLAAEEGITQSAVSQNLAANGAYAIKAADLELEGKFA